MLHIKSSAVFFGILALSAFVVINPTFSQSKSHVDSLTALLNKYSKDDTMKVKLLIALAEEVKKNDTPKALAYAVPQNK